MQHPEDNRLTEDRWRLGKQLFYDRRLSRDSSLSCASCHRPELAFSDDLSFSPGVEERPGTRNSPTLGNVAYHPYLLREGGVPTLEMQVLVPIHEHNEMDFNIVDLAARLANDTFYRELSKKAYDREFDHFVITRAIACFERTLISGNSHYDQYVYQQREWALNASERRGMELFFSEKANCFACHGGFNFTNYAFANNGLYMVYEDDGLARVTGKEEDKHLFKVPSLRNAELTGPYMHDGSMQTLREVVEHYVSGGTSHPQKSEEIRPLMLSEREKQDLVNFLRSLTDHSFINNPLFYEEHER